jgi:hypothetical protein
MCVQVCGEGRIRVGVGIDGTIVVVVVLGDHYLFGSGLLLF